MTSVNDSEPASDHQTGAATTLTALHNISRIGVAIVGLLLILGSLRELSAAGRGIDVRNARVDGTPVQVFLDRQSAGPRPTVLISHGFAGSQQLMLSYAQALARRGYLAVTFDYLGHGRHPEALRGDITKVEGATEALVAQTKTIMDFALSQPEADGRVAILGHSMASDIIVRTAARDTRIAATVAISMFSTAVTADTPRNLLVIVGDLEGFLKDEALRVLGLVTESPREGVTVGAFADGSARRIAFAEGVEHVGVLFSEEAIQEAGDWLDATFGRSAAPLDADHRGLAVVALLLGLGVLAWPLSTLLPRLVRPSLGASLGRRELLAASLGPALITPVALMAFPADFMGVLVGGYLAVHFAVYGLTGAVFLWLIRRRSEGTLALTGNAVDAPTQTAWRAPGWRFAMVTFAATLYVAGAFAWALDSFVTSYAITPTRLPLVAMTLVGTLTYFLVDEWIAHGEHTVRGAHLITRLCFLLSLGIAVALSFEELFFLVIIAAVIVIYFLVYGLFSRWIYRATGHPAVGAIANAVSFAWALGAVFPFLAAQV